EAKSLPVIPEVQNEERNKSNGKGDYVEFEEVNFRNKISGFENVFAIDGDRLEIISDVPGSSVARRMINLILLYLWGKYHLGIEEVGFSELREVCEKHGELDKPNFAKHLHLNKKYFIINGNGKWQSAKLIRPGFKEAEILIQELNK
ncbi:MAG: hypothetical protein ABUL44_04760, partial [Flavobacterium sp.]